MNLENAQLEAFAAARESTQVTRRAVSEPMEKHLFTPYPILDHGHIMVTDYMGTDAAICEAARNSYGKGTKTVNEDKGLIRYLMRHRHTTPIEMVEIKVNVKLPIFVARQWIRQRTASLNEMSARYSILDREFYIPNIEDLAAQSTTNNQGRGAVLVGAEAQRVLEILKEDSTRCYDNYEEMIAQERADGVPKSGLARELARMNLPANVYTSWTWKIDGHNLLNFLASRMDSHAQYEIRVYANKLGEIVQDWLPYTYEAFDEYRLGSVNMSKSAMVCLKKMLAGEIVTQETSGMSKGEWREFENSIAA